MQCPVEECQKYFYLLKKKEYMTCPHCGAKLQIKGKEVILDTRKSKK